MTALVLDCDGVLADTERDGHRCAFNRVFEEFGLPVQWSVDEYGEKLKIAGGKERVASLLTRDFVKANDLPQDSEGQMAWLNRFHRRKSEVFREMVEHGQIPPRAGVARLVDEAFDAGWTLAVASTSALASVEAVLRHVVGSERAAAVDVFAGDIVPVKKPDPAIYRLVVESLGLTADQTVVIEDSRNGLLAAVGAGLPCVVTVSNYTKDEDFAEARLVLSSLGDANTPARVIADRCGATPDDEVGLADLKACFTSPSSKAK